MFFLFIFLESRSIKRFHCMQKILTQVQDYTQKHPFVVSLFFLNLFIFGYNQIPSYAPIIAYPGLFDFSFILAHFSHISWWHLGVNMLVLLQVGSIIDQLISAKKFMILVVLLWLGLVLGAYMWMQTPSLGFSGIGIGLLSYLGSLLYYQNQALSKNILKWVAINVLIGFLPQISLLMHLLGALIGIGLSFFIKADQNIFKHSERF